MNCFQPLVCFKAAFNECFPTLEDTWECTWLISFCGISVPLGKRQVSPLSKASRQDAISLGESTCDSSTNRFTFSARADPSDPSDPNPGACRKNRAMHRSVPLKSSWKLSIGSCRTFSKSFQAEHWQVLGKMLQGLILSEVGNIFLIPRLLISHNTQCCSASTRFNNLQPSSTIINHYQIIINHQSVISVQFVHVYPNKLPNHSQFPPSISWHFAASCWYPSGSGGIPSADPRRCSSSAATDSSCSERRSAQRSGPRLGGRNSGNPPGRNPAPKQRPGPGLIDPAKLDVETKFEPNLVWLLWLAMICCGALTSIPQREAENLVKTMIKLTKQHPQMSETLEDY